MATTDTAPNYQAIVECIRKGYQKANAVEFDMSQFGYSNTSDDEIDARRSEFDTAKTEFLGIIRDIATQSGVDL